MSDLSQHDTSAFEYDGRVYVRPVSRGIVMFDSGREVYVDDAVPDGYYRMTITFQRVAPEEERQAVEDFRRV